MIIIKNITIINGDGSSCLENGHIVIYKEVINEVSAQPFRDDLDSAEMNNVTIIDGKGNYAIPGIINHHCHCISQSPFMATAGLHVNTEKWQADLKTHLQHGTTTLMTVDCFALSEEIDEAQKLTRINVKFSTGHLPILFQAAKTFDGEYLLKKHVETNVLQQLNQGAAAIGEIGAGVSLGGSGQDYKYIPAALEKATGRRFDVPHCCQLKYAVLGRFIDPSSFDADSTRQCLKEMGLSDTLTPEKARKIVTKSVMKGFAIAINGIAEATKAAIRYGVPIIVHNAAPSAQAVIDAAKMACGKTTFIAAHSNHSSFMKNEAVAYAEMAKKAGAVIDVGTLDSYGKQKIIPNPENICALLKEDLIDLISTDYGGGNFDSILEVVKSGVSLGIPLAKVIAMCTSNVAKTFPLLAPNRGTLEKGKIADIAIINRKNLTDVTDVIIGGTVALQDHVVQAV